MTMRECGKSIVSLPRRANVAVPTMPTIPALAYFPGHTTGPRPITASGKRKPAMLQSRTSTGVTLARHTAPVAVAAGPTGLSPTRAATLESIREIAEPVSMTNRALWLSKSTWVVAKTLPARRRTLIGTARRLWGRFLRG
jgi:hypothetical protein